MSVNSLSNFGVPGLNGERSASLQPIFTTHFRVTMFNFGTGQEPAPYDITRQTKKVSLPSVSFDETKIHNYVSTVYIVSRGEWEQGTIEFMDDITNSVRRRVEGQIAKQQNFFDQTVARAGENYKFEMDIDLLAGGATAGESAADPNIIRKYSYAGCTLISNDDGEMTYESPTPKNIIVKFRYDNVITFDHNGSSMITYSHENEIQSQLGTLSTGSGSSGGSGVSTSGASTRPSLGSRIVDDFRDNLRSFLT